MPNKQVKPNQAPIYKTFLDAMRMLGVKQKSTLELLWAKLSENPEIKKNDMVAALIDHSKAYFPVASHLSVKAYDELSPPDFFPQSIGFPDDKAIAKAYGRALAVGNEDKTVDRLAGVAQRFLWNVSRETFVHNANREGVGWKRAASDNACPFCKLLVLSTSKIVYHDAGSLNTHYHDNCHCFIVRADDAQHHEDLNVWENEYNQAVQQAGSSKIKPLMAAWRQIDNDA